MGVAGTGRPPVDLGGGVARSNRGVDGKLDRLDDRLGQGGEFIEPAGQEQVRARSHEPPRQTQRQVLGRPSFEKRSCAFRHWVHDLDG